MTVKLETWLDELATHAPGASIPAMEQALQSALKDFLLRSGAFAKEIPGVLLRKDRPTYTLSKQPEGPIIFLYELFYKGRTLSFVPAENWLRLQPNAGEPTHFRRYVDEPLRFTVWPTPSADLPERVIPYVAFGYGIKCQEYLPDLFSTHWYEYILSGAIFKLCSQQNKPYSDATLAQVHAKLFRAGIATARDQARKQFTRSETPFVFPKWA